jgi:uncharacterized protein involved in outer membrane biogenesis
LLYGATALPDFDMHTRVLPNRIALDALGFTFAGGKVAASGSAQSVAAGTHVAVNAAMSDTGFGQLLGSAGLATDQITGKLDARLALDMTGGTLARALKAGRGQAVIAMARGRVSRNLLEQVSTDLRTLFRPGEGWVDMICLLGIIELRNGLATISPLRLRTADTTLVAGGQFDPLSGRLDVTVKTSGSPSLFALRVPLRIQGDLGSVSVRPNLGSSADWLDASAREEPERRLPPDLQQLAQANPCLH